MFLVPEESGAAAERAHCAIVSVARMSATMRSGASSIACGVAPSAGSTPRAALRAPLRVAHRQSGRHRNAHVHEKLFGNCVMLHTRPAMAGNAATASPGRRAQDDNAGPSTAFSSQLFRTSDIILGGDTWWAYLWLRHPTICHPGRVSRTSDICASSIIATFHHTYSQRLKFIGRGEAVLGHLPSHGTMWYSCSAAAGGRHWRRPSRSDHCALPGGAVR